MTVTEYCTHLSLWSMVGAPLIAGNDLRSMTREIQYILTIPIAKCGPSAILKRTSPHLSVPIGGNSRPALPSLSVALFNRGEMPNPVSIAWSTMQLKRVESVRDVWTHASVKPGDTGFDTVVPSHGVVMVRVTGR